MSLQVRDLRCVECGNVVLDVQCKYANYPECGICKGEMCVTWEAGRPPKTDVYGSPQWNEGVGDYVRSTRDAEKKMADEGFYPAGDPVGGARSDHRIKGTGFSYSGQTSRLSTAERAPGGKRV